MNRRIPRSGALTHSWQISFADLLGVLLCFFVLRYALGVPMRAAKPSPLQATSTAITNHYLATLLKAQLPSGLQISEQSGDIVVEVNAPLSDDDIRLTAEALRRSDRLLIVEASGRDWAGDFQNAAQMSIRLQHAGYEHSITTRTTRGAPALAFRLATPHAGAAT